MVSEKTNRAAHIIVFGNEKGGSGKSTSAMHVAIALLRLGYKVGTVDLDARQGTFTRYMKNRWSYNAQTDHSVPCPLHMPIERSRSEDIKERRAEEEAFLSMALSELQASCDFVVIDTPGTDSYLSRLAHGKADTLVTPMNDSLLDLDLLAHINGNNEVEGLSVYAVMVQEQRQDRRDQGQDIDWIVMRNRLTHHKAKNKELVGNLLDEIALLCGFRNVHGFGERVIFRELFAQGLTLLDLKDFSQSLTLSQIKARQEVRQLIQAIAPERKMGYATPPKNTKDL